MTQKVTFTLSMDRLTKNVEIRASTGRRVADVRAMATEAMTLRYADIMCAALNAAAEQPSNAMVNKGMEKLE